MLVVLCIGNWLYDLNGNPQLCGNSSDAGYTYLMLIQT